ncbi:MAG: FAD-dependent oxidoreductase [Pseudomonadota bacterium]
MTSSGDCIVVGAGVIGLCTALYLQEKGRTVSLIDRLPPGEGTSSGNAGIISAGAAQPEAMPGIWKDMPGMVLGRLAPVSLRFTYLPRFLPWLRRFIASSSPSRAEASSVAIRGLSRHARVFLEPLAARAGAGTLLKQEGLLYIYEEEDEFCRAKQNCAFYDRRGVDYRIIESRELGDLEPALRPGLAGGVLIPEAAHTLSPLALSRALFDLFQRQGGGFHQEEVGGFQTSGGRVTAVQASQQFNCSEVFVTAGAWSHLLARQLGSDVPLDTERGYHQELPDPGLELKQPLLFARRAFCATSMRDGLRLAGTVEFAGLAAAPDYRRARVLAEHARELFPRVNTSGGKSWMGYRPSLPDSVPVVSRSPHFANVYYGFGHGHLGLTLSGVTGATLAALATGGEAPVDTSLYRIDRKF